MATRNTFIADAKDKIGQILGSEQLESMPGTAAIVSSAAATDIQKVLDKLYQMPEDPLKEGKTMIKAAQLAMEEHDYKSAKFLCLEAGNRFQAAKDAQAEQQAADAKKAEEEKEGHGKI